MITDIASLREYIKNRYGGGVGGAINVELGVEQIDQSIEDALQAFRRYNYNEGLYEDYLTLTLVPGVSAYDMTGSGVEDVVGFSIATGSSNSINQLFTPANLVLGGSFQVFNGDGGGMALANYQTAILYLKTVEEIFAISYRVDYRELQQKLIVTPTPTESLVAVLKVYRQENVANLYNHLLVKKLAVAYCKQVWGKILTKYGSMQLPGGGSYFEFGMKMWDEGKKDEEELEKRMGDEGEKFGFVIG